MTTPPMPEEDWNIPHPLQREHQLTTELQAWGRQGWAEAERLEAACIALERDNAEHALILEQQDRTLKAMTETAAENSRVHIEMHNDLTVQDELIRTQGKQIKDYLDAAVKAEAERDALRAQLAEAGEHIASMRSVCALRDDQFIALRAQATALEVAKRVCIALDRDGFYGPYVMGTALWDEFVDAFKGA